MVKAACQRRRRGSAAVKIAVRITRPPTQDPLADWQRASHPRVNHIMMRSWWPNSHKTENFDAHDECQDPIPNSICVSDFDQPDILEFDRARKRGTNRRPHCSKPDTYFWALARAFSRSLATNGLCATRKQQELGVPAVQKAQCARNQHVQHRVKIEAKARLAANGSLF
jgi:hypothetical protein